MIRPKFHTGVFWLQWIGNLLLILPCFAWLQIPDSHVWQFAFSIVSAIVLIVAFLWLYSHTFRSLYKAGTAAPVWQRWLVLIIVILVGYLLLQGLGVLRSHESLYAGYWNSKLSAGMRTFFTFPRLVSWQDHFYDFLQWLFAALLLPMAFVGAGLGLHNERWKETGRVYRRIGYWVFALAAAFVGTWLTALLVGWKPTGKPAAEIVSVLLRVGMAYTLDIILWVLVLGVVAGYLETPRPDED
jgi:hypothetical protein